jgi:hypothetical protein
MVRVGPKRHRGKKNVDKTGQDRNVHRRVNYQESARESEVSERIDGAKVWNENINTAI